MLPWVLQSKRTRSILTTVFIFWALFLLALALVPELSFAQTDDTFGLQEIDETVDLANTDIRIIVGRIIRAVLGLLGAIALIIIIYAGYVIMTAGGNEDKLAEGRRILINATIGLAIILAAFAITQFVISKLSGAINPPPTTTQRQPIFENFAGSGGLGRVVRDHYPFRDQTGVKRNTKVAITFFESINPGSLIDNTNNTCWGEGGVPVICGAEFSEPYYGDCISTAENFSFAAHCDRLKPEVIELYATPAEDAPEATPALVEATVGALYEGGDERQVYTIVIRPLEFLGIPDQLVPYTVNITNKVQKQALAEVNGELQPVSIFHNSNTLTDNYIWEFETDGLLDQEPPVVESVNPDPNQTQDPALAVARNQYVQINFNEAMDPTMLQAMIADKQDEINLHFKSPVLPAGSWRIANGYRSVEFYPDAACGQNSCGDPLYCLPLDCAEESCTNNYTVSVETANLIQPAFFEAVPFSGVMDMQGNALDGNADGIPQGKVANDEEPDNYHWKFVIKNEIDKSGAYIQTMIPGIDKENVSILEPVEIGFSHKLLWGTLEDGITITEYGQPSDLSQVDVLWSKPFGTVEAGKSLVKVVHRIFGPNDLDFYYFPQVSSELKSINGNCLYPGRGPDGEKGNSPLCIYEEDSDGVPVPGTGQQCVKVLGTDPNNDTGCVVSAISDEDKTQADVPKCLEYITGSEISPLTDKE